MRKSLAFLFLLIAGTLLKAGTPETINFDIMLLGDKIGTMSISREAKDDGTEVYTLITYSKAKILWIEKENKSRYDITYKNGKLVSSYYTEIENGERKRWTNVSFDGKQYQLDGYKGKSTFTEVPTFSVVTIYFKDISKVKRVFYEAEGDFGEMKHPEPNTWEFNSSDGHRNVYHFVNGKINSMEFHISIATIKMVRVK